MTVELKVPVFPESVTDGTLVSWKKKPGEPVARDEVVAEIETDKVVFEVPATDEGVLEAVLVDEGATVVSGQVIARIASAVAEAKASAELEEQAVQPAAAVAARAGSPGPLSPSAKKMVMENKINPELISGSGKDGRVLKEDVERYLQKVQAESETATAVNPASQSDSVVTRMPAQERIEKRVPMSRLRARIAERLLQSQRDAAILTTFNEIDMQPVMDLRAVQATVRAGTRRALGFYVILCQGLPRSIEAFSRCQCVDREQGHHLPWLLRYRYRGGFSARPGGAGDP